MKRTVQFVIFIIIFFAMCLYYIPNEKEERRSLLEMFRNISFNGIVVNKYLDSTQHSVKILEVRDFNTKSIIKVNLLGDNSNSYKLINKTDTIWKMLHSDTLYIKKNGEQKILNVLDFGYNEAKK